jgi:hypothetical protein
LDILLLWQLDIEDCDLFEIVPKTDALGAFVFCYLEFNAIKLRKFRICSVSFLRMQESPNLGKIAT